tara:strand:- start:95 stop:337 length:243 start_codon:yes stop_codon:yes gene_type:complete
MAKLNKLMNFLDTIDKEIKEEVYNRVNQQNEQEDKWKNWADSEKGQDYIYETEALEELTFLIYEVIDKAQKIKNKDYYSL